MHQLKIDILFNNYNFFINISTLTYDLKKKFKITKKISLRLAGSVLHYVKQTQRGHEGTVAGDRIFHRGNVQATK